MTDTVALYSAVDDQLTHYEVDVEHATLTRRATVTLPAKLQYAWPHPSRPVLYTSTSDGGPRIPSTLNHVTAFTIGPDGALGMLGEPSPLPRRAVHMCVDPSGRYTLNGHNFQGGGMTVQAIEPDGSVGRPIGQSPGLDFGVYPHQVMAFPSGRTALIVDRGNNAAPSGTEDPGALRSFGFQDGVLSPGQVVAPGGGYGFGPRHVAFHPSQPWMYVADERFNRLYMFRCPGDRMEPHPAYTLPTLANPHSVQPRQLGGAIHVHPSGRFVFVANRADGTIEREGRKFFGGGENNIAVFAIDPSTGEPRRMQHADTHSFHVRTFSCDPSGRLLVTASIKALPVLVGDELRTVSAALTVFRVDRESGHLEYVRKYDVETSGARLQYWMGIVRRE